MPMASPDGIKTGRLYRLYCIDYKFVIESLNSLSNPSQTSCFYWQTEHNIDKQAIWVT